jgi:methyltransferase
MIADSLGPPQIAATLVLAQRGLEELHSARNTRALLRAGGREEGRGYYPVVAVTHLAWLASVFFLILAEAPVAMLPLAMYLGLQIVRYWIIGTLGPYWTHRIITRDSAPIEKRGPYRFLRHPNYAVTIAETFLLPAMFGAYALGFIMTAIWSAVVYYKIVLEDAALSARRAASAGTSSATAK